LDLLTELGEVLPPSRVVGEGEEVARHGGAIFTYHAARNPEAVVYPEGRDEVAAVLRFASDRGVPVVPYEEGSSLEGHTIPLRGGIRLDLDHLDRVVEVRPDDFVARVEPGITHGALNNRLAEHGLHFPVDPGWGPSLGGMERYLRAAGRSASRCWAWRWFWRAVR
jgi:D-lactate dehydrogenase (cytochrome)